MEKPNGREAVSLFDKLHPDVIVMDIAMPLLNGLQATHAIMKESRATRVLILSSYSDPEYINQAMLGGASGYLIKQSSAPFLVDAIREVIKGNTYFSASIAQSLRDECQSLFDKSHRSKRGALFAGSSSAGRRLNAVFDNSAGDGKAGKSGNIVDV